jgi:thioredoxin-related protein
MKNICMFLFLLIASGSIQAQELSWNTNLEKAIEISESTNKPLMMFFTGSDWCGWCKRLQAEVFYKPEFATWAKANVVLLELDFPRRTPLAPELQTQNSNLQQFFGIQGYPTIWFVKPSKLNGKINFEKLGTVGYVPGGPPAWIDAANSILKNK